MKKILIVDDDPVSVKLIEFTLVKKGYTVIVCREGNCVIETAEKELPELAILDLNLPGRTGYELMEDFKSHSKLSSIPIIFITEQGRNSTEETLINAGAKKVYTKPFSPKKLINDIESLFCKTSNLNS